MLKVGDKSYQVLKLQRLLKIDADGVFGSLTRKAVVRFQMHKGLANTGVVDNETWLALLTNKSLVEAIDEDADIASQFFTTNFNQMIQRYYLPKGSIYRGSF